MQYCRYINTQYGSISHTGIFYFTLGNCSPKLKSKMQHPASSFSEEKGVGPIWDNGSTQTNGGGPQKIGK